MKRLQFFRLLFLGVFVFFIVVNASSQTSDTCPKLVDEAMQLTGEVCKDIGRNQACYGNLQLRAEPHVDGPTLEFDKPGDIVNIEDIATLTLSPMNLTEHIWGISLLKVQANIPDTLPGQNVTIVLFGDVELRAEQTVEMPVSVRMGAAINVRNGPTKDSPVVTALAGTDTVTANGRNATGDWLRIVLEDGRTGWVFANLIETDNDIQTLNVVDANASAATAPLQAFFLKTGIGDSACDEAPDSGIIIQTPQGVGEIALRINAVEIQLGSTAFFAASEDSGLQVYTLQGEAEVKSLGVSQTVEAGTTTYVALNENLVASDVPVQPEPFAPDDVSGISAPLGLLAGEDNFVPFPHCEPNSGPLLAGQYALFTQGNGCWDTIEQAQAAFDGHIGKVIIDGIEVDSEMQPPGPNSCKPNAYAGGVSTRWLATTGTHTVSITWSGPIENFETTCTFTVYE